MKPADLALPEAGPQPSSRTLTIGSYNLHSCVGLDGQRSPSRIAQVLREMNCDVVALQEVDNQPGDHEESMQLAYLERSLAMQSVAGLRLIRHTGEYGNAILTRFPVLSVRRHDLSYSRYEPRGALDVQLDVGGVVLRVLATHLGLLPSERRDQWRRLMVALSESPLDMPTVLLGDMNEWFRPARTLHEADKAFGKPPSPADFPAFAPLLALTRIWVRPRAALISIEVHRSKLTRRASDHLPLKAAIDMTRLVQPR